MLSMFYAVTWEWPEDKASSRSRELLLLGNYVMRVVTFCSRCEPFLCEYDNTTHECVTDNGNRGVVCTVICCRLSHLLTLLPSSVPV